MQSSTRRQEAVQTPPNSTYFGLTGQTSKSGATPGRGFGKPRGGLLLCGARSQIRSGDSHLITLRAAR